ncbi:MAG: TonB-dependent receptor [bacterium]
MHRTAVIFVFRATAVAAVVCLAPAPGHADPLDLRPIQVKDSRIEPGSAQAEDTAFSTTLDAAKAASEGGDLTEHLARSVGVQVRRTGSHGDFSSVLIRGSSPNQVGVFLDGIPLSQGRGSLVDLSLYPLLTLARVEIFRGYVPAEFGSEGIGGAINLIPARAGKHPLTRLTAGLGAFGFTQLGLARSARHGAFLYAVNIGFQSSQGDFPYYSDNDTIYEPSDDAWRTRQNNDSRLFSVMAWTQWRVSRDLRISLLESFAHKDRGLAGFGTVQAENSRLRTIHQIFDLKIDKRKFLVPSLSAMLRANVRYTQEHLLDEEHSLSLTSRDRVDDSLTVGAIGRLSWAPHDPQLWSLIPEWRYESYRGRDPLRNVVAHGEMPRSQRYRFGVALRDRIVLWNDRLSLTPVLRFDALYNDVDGDLRDGIPLTNSSHWFFSPRLGVRLRLVRGVDLRGNVGRYFRPPSMYELYGDRGTTVENPNLKPESGVSGDFGLSVRLHRKAKWLPLLVAEAAFFGRHAEDLIQWQRNLRSAQAVNISQARVLGGEFSLGAWLRLHRQLQGRLTANYTLLWTQNRSGQPLVDGNQLPGRPLHELNGRADLVWRWKRFGIGVHYAVTHISDSFLDEANRFAPVPQRTLHDVGIAVLPWVRDLTITATFKNITNVRVEQVDGTPFGAAGAIPRALSDFAGYPLPGWSFYVTVVWSLGGPRKKDAT